VIAFAGIAVALLWVRTAEDLFLQLALIETANVGWYALRLASTPASPGGRPRVPGQGLPMPAPARSIE
jgi:hypothetical protein